MSDTSNEAIDDWMKDRPSVLGDREVYRVAGPIKAIRQWAQERGIHWSHVQPITRIEQTMGLPQGERLIVTGPYCEHTHRIVDEARPFMSVEFQPTIPEQ